MAWTTAPPRSRAASLWPEAASNAGIRVLAATPHVRGDYEFDLRRIVPAVSNLNHRLITDGVPLDVIAGGEAAITSLLDLDDEALEAVRLGEGAWLLVESPYAPTGPVLEAVLLEAMKRGLRPLLAHPERSPCFQRDVERLADIVRSGCLC